MGQLKNYSNDSEDVPRVVERVNLSFNWNLPVLVISLIAVVVYWPLLFEFASKQIDSVGQAETSQTSEKNKQTPVVVDDFSGIDDEGKLSLPQRQ